MKFKNILIYIFVICQFGFTWGKGNSQTYLTLSDGTFCAYLPMDLTIYNKILPINKSDNHNNYGLKFEINEGTKTPTQYYNSGHFTGEGTSLYDKPNNYFQDAYQNSSIENNILNYHECYANQNFLSYARTLPHYNEHILDIHKRIKKGEEFIVSGFKQWFCLWWGGNEFHDFVKKEANRIKEFQNKVDKVKDTQIKQQQRTPRLRFDNTKEIEFFIDRCEQQTSAAYDSKNDEICTRLNARLKAIEKTRKQNGKCIDYTSQVKHPNFNDPYADVFNNCYGTALDKQLHEELCDTRIAMIDLQDNYADNIHVRAFAPIVFLATAHAKKENDAIKAFSLSDFSYDLVRIVNGSINLMTIGASGIVDGAKTFLTSKHWKDMGIGFLKLTVMLVDEYGRQESLDNSYFEAAILGKPDVFLERSKAYEDHHRAVALGLKQEIFKTSEKIKKMSLEEIVYKGFKHGTIFILDGVAINAGTLATSTAGRKFVSQMADVLTSPMAEEFALEAAGVGKITLEEGADIANMAIEAVEKNPELLSKGKSVTQVFQDVATGIMDKDLAQMYKTVSLGKGSTGRRIPRSLKEQLVMKEVLSNPLPGAKELQSITMTDPRWLAKDGWVKMAKNVNDVETHFLYNRKTGAFDDFKFK
jgi:hypothetical protein